MILEQERIAHATAVAIFVKVTTVVTAHAEALIERRRRQA